MGVVWVARQASLDREVAIKQLREGAGPSLAAEMLDPAPPPTPATDVFLLGACLYHAITRSPPHAGDDTAAVLHQVHAWRGPRLDPSVPEELADLLRQSMAARPQDRLQTADTSRQRIEAFLEHRAAAGLAEAATRSLDALRAELSLDLPDPVVIDERFTEAPFGFSQALAAWPDNPAALLGQAQLFAAMAEHCIDRGDLEAAAAHLERLSDHPAREPLQGRLQQSRELRASDRRVAQEQDVSVAAWSRAVFFMLLGLIWGLLAVLVLLWFGTRILEWGIRLTSLSFLLTCVAILLAPAHAGAAFAIGGMISIGLVLGVLILQARRAPVPSRGVKTALGLPGVQTRGSQDSS